MFALIRGNDEGWSSPQIVGLLALSAISLVCFLVVEARQDLMLDLTLFRKRTFNGASLVAFALQGSAVALIIYITLWFQSILGFTPLQAGLRMLALTALALLLSPVAGRLTARVPPRLLLAAGLAMIGGGILLMTGVDASSSWTALLPCLIVTGAGMESRRRRSPRNRVGPVPPVRPGWPRSQLDLPPGGPRGGDRRARRSSRTQIARSLTTALAHTSLVSHSAA